MKLSIRSSIRNLTVGCLVPVLSLAFLLTLGTRKGTAWRENLEKPKKSFALAESFSSIAPTDLDWIARFSGEWGRYGLTLAPGRAGYVHLRLKRIPGADLLVRVWAYDYGSCRIRWWPAGENPSSARTLSLGGSLVGKGLRINPPAEDRAIILEISGENRTGRPQVLLDRISVSSSSYRPVNGWVLGWWFWGVLTAFWWWCAAKRRWWEPPGGIVLWVVGLMVVLVGGTVRLKQLSFLNGVPLDPDVVMYQVYSDRLNWFDSENGFYSAAFGEREPLWVAILKLWQLWVGNGDLAIRLLTSLFSTIVIASTGTLLYRCFREWLWITAGMLMVCLNPSIILESFRGLRSEAMTIAFIIFLLVSLPNGVRRFHPLKAGIFVGIWALLRGPALTIAFGMWGGIWLTAMLIRHSNMRLWVPQGYSLKKILLAGVVAFCLFVPHLYGLQKRHGDWRWPSYGYARWNANVEFPERLGTPGFPTVEEFRKSSYAGPRISYTDYLFRLHTPFQVVKYQLMGWVEIMAYQVLSISPYSSPLAIQLSSRRLSGMTCLLGPSVILAFFMGLLVLAAWVRIFFHRKLWWAPPMLLWGTFYVAFLYHVRLVEPIRHTVHIYPLLVLVTIWGIRWLWEGVHIMRLRNYVRIRWIQEQ